MGTGILSPLGLLVPISLVKFQFWSPQRYVNTHTHIHLSLLPRLPHPAFLFIQASGDAVISRLPDQAEARKTSLQDATSVYDLLTIGMVRRGQYAMLSEVF